MSLEINFGEVAIKSAPVVGTAAADQVARVFFGLSLHEWFYVAAIGYTLVQSAAVIVKIRVTMKGGDVK